MRKYHQIDVYIYQCVCGVFLWVCYFPIGILGQVWYLIVWIPELCTLTFFRYDELREKSQNMLLPVDKRVSDMILKLQTFAHMDNKTVPYAKVTK